MARLQLPVEPDEIKLLPIFPDQRALPGCRINQKKIMPADVPFVEVYRYFVRVILQNGSRFK
jgi:hypothetical protein